MSLSNHNWLPPYCNPYSFLPSVQETIILFQHPPYLFQDFVGRVYALLRSDMIRQLGFAFDPRIALPCKWKCSDESLFGVDLSLYAYSGHYPFDKGLIGGFFNEGSVGAAVHHSPINIDFGGSHVGYRPGPNGGQFGRIARPLHEQETSTDCGYMMGLLAPFKEIYDDACKNILLFCPDNEHILVSIPNEFIQPSWSSHRIKLLVDLEGLVSGLVPYDVNKPFTHKLAGRSLCYVHPHFLEQLPPGKLEEFRTPHPTPIGHELVAEYFHIFDDTAEISDGVPVQRILPYIKYILSSRWAPYPLKAAVTSANIEYNRLTDTVRAEEYRPYSFASFTGVFIDLYDEKLHAYVNLFQPIGVSIKVAGKAREVEFSPAEFRAILDQLPPTEPVLPLRGVLGYDRADHVLESFTFRPI